MDNLKFDDDVVLVKYLIEGEASAFRYVVSHYQPSMKYVAQSIVGPSIADEVVQESWVSVIKALPGFEGRSSLKTWILRIVSNSAKTRLRKESRSIAVGDANDIEIASIPAQRFQTEGHWAAPPQQWNTASPEAILACEELEEIIYCTLDSLPSMQRTILNLRDMEGMTMEEICKILDISESNSRVLLHRARSKIWQAIDSHQD